MSKAYLLFDNFNDNSRDVAKWGNSSQGVATYSETGGEVVITPGTNNPGYANYGSTNGYDLTDAYIVVKVTQMVNNGGTQAFIRCDKDGAGTDILEMLFEDGSLYFRHWIAGSPTNLASVTFNITTHKWWRIRNFQGQILWETSPDGVTWTVQYREDNPFVITNVYLQIAAGTYNNQASPGAVHYDNFNIPPLASFKENFNDNSFSDHWFAFEQSSGQIDEVNHRLESVLPASASAGAQGVINTESAHELADSYAFMEIIEIPNEDTNCDGDFIIYNDLSNWVAFIIEGGVLFCQHLLADVRDNHFQIPYDPVAHRWLRIREASGVAYWEVSPDGRVWTILASKTHNLTTANAHLLIGGVCYKAETNPGNFIADNINTIPLDKLKDNFNDNSIDPAKWTKFEANGATYAETGRRGKVTFPASGSSGTDGDITSVNSFDLSESNAILQVLEIPSSSTDADAELRIYTDSDNWFRFITEAGGLYFQRRRLGSQGTVDSTTFNAVTHKWWRLRESGGVIYWDTSPDGKVWTNRASYTHTMDVSKMKVLIAGTCFKNETNPGFFIFDNFNSGMIELRNAPFNIISGDTYRLSFKVRSTVNQLVGVKVSNSGLTTDSLDDDFRVYADEWKMKKFEFTATASDEASILRFIPSTDALHSLYIDKVTLINLSKDRKQYRIMRIRGSMFPGSFLQTLTVREKTANETG